MLAAIGLEDLSIRCIIGVLPHERIAEQEILVDLRVEADISRCVAADTLQDTVNYVQMADICTAVAQEGYFGLVETYAHAVTERLLADFDIVSVWIKVKKPAAVGAAKWATVELKRVQCAEKRERMVGMKHNVVAV